MVVIRNGVRLGYPFIESLLSLLPLCDEVVVSEGFSDDDTWYWLERLQQKFPRKLRLVRRRWPEGMTGGGAIGAMQTQAMRLCRGRWIYLLQADEIMPEQNVRYLRELCAPRLLLRRLARGRRSSPAAHAPSHAPDNAQSAAPRDVGHVASREHRRDVAVARALEIVSSRAFNSFVVDFAHVGEGFQSQTFDEPYRWATRLVRNRPLIYSGDDGWQMQGPGSWPTGAARLPHPIWHLGYVFPVSAWRKSIHHASLYPGHPHFDHAVPHAQERLAQFERGEPLDLPRENPLGLPPLIAPLIGEPEYRVREELFDL